MDVKAYTSLKECLEKVVANLNQDRGILDKILGKSYRLKLDEHEIGVICSGVYIATIIDEWISHEKNTSEETRQLGCALNSNFLKETEKIKKYLHEFSHSSGINYNTFYGYFGHGNQKPIMPESLLQKA
ncbi:MAG: hypothetical protein IB618_00820 [Candidatus Pacearchaeota archaeon]|nr:MAG: hypothetical protein IB618_00820 [Candidatus Pacearchaeota archaeon]